MNPKEPVSENSTKASDNKRSLSRIIFLIPLAAATLTTLTIATYHSINSYHKYLKGNEKLKMEFPEQQRQELKFRILSAKDYIHYARTHSAVEVNKYLDKRYDEANSLLAKGIGLNADGSPTITPVAKANLHAAFDDSHMTLAVTDPNGIPIFITDQDSHSTPENSHEWQKISDAVNAGNILDWKNGWTQLVSRREQPYCLLSKPLAKKGFDLFAFISSSDSIRLLQELVLDSLSKIRFDNEEYIFINTYDGKGLITKGIHNRKPLDIITGKDTNWIKIFEKELEYAKKPGGGYHSYQWQKDITTGYSEKVSYFSGIEDWKWIIGTGMHTDDIMPLLKQREKQLKSSLTKDLLNFVLFLVILNLAIYFITRYVSNLTTSNIRLFVRFLKNAAISLQPLDSTKVHFSEFQTLANAANQMISERNKIKTDLANEQSRLKYIIDSIPDLIFFKDINSNFVGCNHAFEKYIGKKAEEIIGCTEYELFSKTNADSYTESDKILLQTLQPVRTTEWITYPDGSKVLCYTLKTLYFDEDGNVLGFIGISRDITEIEETRQRLLLAKEKAEESDRLKTAFLANMSHEIRTPMNAIIGFSDLLAEEDLSSEDRNDFITKIKLSGEALMNIINDIIDIAKIEAGQLKISDSECDIDSLLSTLYGTFLEVKKRNKKDEIELKVTYPKSEKPLTTVTDPLRLHQVLTNLLSNAIKFTEFGEIEFGYKLENGNIHFFVKDTGIGILRSKQSLLFQRFSQVDGSTTRKYGGTGLGLAISKNIVELLGGTIWIESEPGQGSTFHFTIPNRLVSHSEDVRIEDTDDAYNWKDRTILIAEDVDQNYMLMEAILRFTHINLIHAPNGQVAIDMAKDHPEVELILMDIQLPVKTGYEAIEEILQFRPEIPIISFTAYALPREREKSLEAGCVEFLNKPIKPDVLLSVIRKYLKDK